MVTDPVGDMIIQIKNAGLASKPDLTLPYSRMKHAVSEIFLKEGYVSNVRKEEQGNKSVLKITLKYVKGKPVITNVKRKSKPGLRVYIKKTEIPFVLGGMGTAIISTPKGIMTGKQARKIGIGGEFICEVW